MTPLLLIAIVFCVAMLFTLLGIVLFRTILPTASEFLQIGIMLMPFAVTLSVATDFVAGWGWLFYVVASLKFLSWIAMVGFVIAGLWDTYARAANGTDR